ncbi:MAG: hypothetical protein K940chlam9_00561 [Chlamydiae bacterium]|nr:hypothetical protein [Chlamydiota bacterium]
MGSVYRRILKSPDHKSFFLFGPRGTGKTSWVKSHFKNSLYLDLLEAEVFVDLTLDPGLLEKMIPEGFCDWIIIDEVQKIPALLNEVHRLIESKKYRFVLTGSSTRQLRKKGVNLLAGRALTYSMHPLTAIELGTDFDLDFAIEYGLLPSLHAEPDPKKYLQSYVKTYLQEEVLHEGITRNLGAFSRFLASASFSQGSVLNYSEVSRDCGSDRKTTMGFFDILEDLLLAHRIPPFTKRAKRKLVSHPKFYFFDVGVYKTLRPKGPLDSPEEIGGIALETLFFQNLLALNAYFNGEYEIFFWRTATGLEVDFIAYGPKGIFAFEIKRGKQVRSSDLKGLKAFHEEYPMAQLFLVNGSKYRSTEGDVHILPMHDALIHLPEILGLS